MAPQIHNKKVGIIPLIWGGFNALTMIIAVLFFLGIGAFAAFDPNAPTAVMAIFGLFGVVMLALALVFGLPPLVAGYGMLRRKSWARMWGIIAAAVEIRSSFGREWGWE